MMIYCAQEYVAAKRAAGLATGQTDPIPLIPRPPMACRKRIPLLPCISR